jgi:hypothetical protein
MHKPPKVIRGPEVLELMRKAGLEGGKSDYLHFTQKLGPYSNDWLIPTQVASEVTCDFKDLYNRNPGALLNMIMQNKADYSPAVVAGVPMILDKSLVEQTKDGFFADPLNVSEKYSSQKKTF